MDELLYICPFKRLAFPTKYFVRNIKLLIMSLNGNTIYQHVTLCWYCFSFFFLFEIDEGLYKSFSIINLIFIIVSSLKNLLTV